MTQADRDPLVALKKAEKKTITQKESAEEIGITERQIRRLLRKLKSKGDKAVIHALCGRPSNRKLVAAAQEQAIQILSDPVYQGFGPTLAVKPANSTDSHRPLGKEHKLAAILRRQVTNDYTIRYHGRIYQIDRKDIRTGMRGNKVQTENRLDGSIAIRFRRLYLTVTLCQPAAKMKPKPVKTAAAKPAGKSTGSSWNKNFDLHNTPKICQVVQNSITRRKEPAP